MNFYELREKYDSIIFKSFNCAESDTEIKISYFYKLGEFDFEHLLIIPKKYFFHLENIIDKDVFLFNLGIMEIINMLLIMGLNIIKIEKSLMLNILIM